MAESFIDRGLHLTPFWLLAVAVFGGMAVASWVGWWLRRRRNRAPDPKDEDSQEVLSSPR